MAQGGSRPSVVRTRAVERRVIAPMQAELAKEFGTSRNLKYERKLCEAITARRLVEFRYEGDVTFRLFAPHAVYHSTPSRVSVCGAQLQRPSDVLESHIPRVFGVAKIRAFRFTDREFSPDPRFDRRDPRYKNGIICSV